MHRSGVAKLKSRLVMYIFVCYKYFSIITDPQEPDKISMDGVVRLLEDLQLDPSSKSVLLMAWKFQAAAQCEFSRDEFVNGMIDLGKDFIHKTGKESFDCFLIISIL